MKATIVRAAEQKTARWAGGETTELLVFPPGSSLKARDFSVRISSATVELERSDFTALPGFTRYIMPLCGSIKLEHLASGSQLPLEANLAPLSVHRFDGGWQTVSHGICTDFNLMLAQGWEGEMKAISGGEEVVCGPGQILCLYILKPLELMLPDEKYDLLPGDALCVEPPVQPEQIVMIISGDAEGQAAMAKAWRI